MSLITGLLYAALAAYLGGWYLGHWHGNFSLLLFILIASGINTLSRMRMLFVVVGIVMTIISLHSIARAARDQPRRAPQRSLFSRINPHVVVLVLLLILLVVGLGGLPVLLIAFPTTRSLTVIGVPFPWLVLAIAFYPTMWLLARWYAAQSARVERQFRDVLSGR